MPLIQIGARPETATKPKTPDSSAGISGDIVKGAWVDIVAAAYVQSTHTIARTAAVKRHGLLSVRGWLNFTRVPLKARSNAALSRRRPAAVG
jgi:hypothetical protein